MVVLAASLLISLVAGVLSYALLRRHPPAARLGLSFLAAGGGLFGTWLLLFGVLLLFALEPWPISLRQGPDTDFARACFERQLGEPPPAGVSRIYCREEWGFGGDGIRSLRFEFATDAAIERLAERERMSRVETSERSAFRYLAAPSWWPAQAELFALPEAYRCRRHECLWVDRAARVAYFQRAGF